MKRAWSMSLCLATLASGLSSPARAQMGPEETTSEDYWLDVDVPAQRTRRGGTAASLDDARRSGHGIVLGGGGSTQAVPERYTVRRGDTLWDITGRFYANPWLWPRVWSYNPEITNPHWIYPDDQLRLMPEGQTVATLPETGQTVRTVAAAPRSGSVLLRDQGYLDRDALRRSGIISGSPEEHMLLSPYDEVYVQFEEGAQPRPGMQLTVFRQMEPDERESGEEGELVRIFGTVELRSYDANRRLGRGRIVEALDPIERGYRVADMPRRLDLVQPVENAVNLQARVVAALRPHLLVGDYQVVFVNVGGEDGVRVGNRFFIVREGDTWRDNLPQGERAAGATLPGEGELDQYPEEIVAEGRVVNVRPHSAALIVTRSTNEVVLGDRAEMRQGY